jgi:hypothetical protein
MMLKDVNKDVNPQMLNKNECMIKYMGKSVNFVQRNSSKFEHFLYQLVSLAWQIIKSKI